MPKVQAPYPGQGELLPQSMGLTGFWIIENIVALGEPTTPDGEGVFQRAPKSPLGNNVYTFDAQTLADSFNLSLEELFVENKAGRLFLSFNDTSQTTATFKFLCRGIEIIVDFTLFSEQ